MPTRLQRERCASLVEFRPCCRAADLKPGPPTSLALSFQRVLGRPARRRSLVRADRARPSDRGRGVVPRIGGGRLVRSPVALRAGRGAWRDGRTCCPGPGCGHAARAGDRRGGAGATHSVLAGRPRASGAPRTSWACHVQGGERLCAQGLDRLGAEVLTSAIQGEPIQAIPPMGRVRGRPVLLSQQLSGHARASRSRVLQKRGGSA